MRCYGGSRLRRHGNITTWSKLQCSAGAAAEIRTPVAGVVFLPTVGLQRHTTALWLMPIPRALSVQHRFNIIRAQKLPFSLIPRIPAVDDCRSTATITTPVCYPDAHQPLSCLRLKTLFQRKNNEDERPKKKKSSESPVP